MRCMRGENRKIGKSLTAYIAEIRLKGINGLGIGEIVGKENIVHCFAGIPLWNLVIRKGRGR